LNAAASTVHAAFRHSAGVRADAEWLIVDEVTAASYRIEAGPRSWREVADEVERLRKLYEYAGYGHGHRVGLLLENRPAFFTHWLALNALGVSIVPINADMRAAEWMYLIGHSEMCLAVALPGREAALRAAAKEAGAALETMGPDAAGRVPPARTPARLAHQTVGRNSECALLYTSGTTGRPKGCRLANGYFMRAGEWYLGLGELAAVHGHADRFITPLPLSHMNALAFSTMASILSGSSLVQLDRFHPSSWWRSVRDTGATVAHYLGVMPAMLLSAPPSPLDRQHHVRFGFGAGVDPRHHAAFEERFGFPLLEAWAMTETGAAACIMAHREPRHVGTSCFGRADAFVETRIVDDKGVDTPAGVAGELLVRAAGADPRRDFFLGYLKDDAATDEAWADGWFHTGDVVRRTAEGDFHFVDRRKNVIRRSGENISAVEVESVLNQHPAVAASAVAATPDPVRGDEVLACIVLRQAPNLPPPERIAHSIVRHTLERLAYFKAPGYVAFVESLPLTPSQKVQRGELREIARRMPGSAACFDVRMLKRRKKHLDAAATAAGALAPALTGPGSLASPTQYGVAPPSVAGGLGTASAAGALDPAEAPGALASQTALSGIVLTGPPPTPRARTGAGVAAPATSPAPPVAPAPVPPSPPDSPSGGGHDDDDDR
jgi:acyl-CoA synthetase (AMP-forming)/AMP-acid ligase II